MIPGIRPSGGRLAHAIPAPHARFPDPHARIPAPLARFTPLPCTGAAAGRGPADGGPAAAGGRDRRAAAPARRTHRGGVPAGGRAGRGCGGLRGAGRGPGLAGGRETRGVTGWEPPAGPYGPGHRGVDLAARPGTEVLAAATGRVSFAGRVAGRGVLVIELAGSGAPPLRTTYEPVRALVAKGDDVVAGRPVGVLEAGPFHCAAGCLHWGLRRGAAYLDPLSLLPSALLRRGPSRLLPVFGVPEPGAAVAPVAAALSRVRRAGSSRRRCPR
ncbi:M23 family metallopeptidase [Streptomyces microflavus]|nr:M23 family metallopeptidase [Streptomyces microflavus]